MNQTLKITAISLAAFAAYLPVAYVVGRDFVPTPKPEGAIVEPLLKIDKGPGLSYRTEILALAKYSDGSEDSMRSPIILYEGTTPLAPGRSYIRDIEKIGRGRFAFGKF